MQGGDETSFAEEMRKLKHPNELFEYHIKHMANPDYRKWHLSTYDLSDPFQKHLHDLEKNERVYKLEKRRTIPPNKLLKSFDPGTVYKVLKSLRTPATFSMLKNNKDRLDKKITATSLRQYVDALVTRGYVTIADIKLRKKEYPYNFVPRTDISIYYISSRRGGRRYVRLYEAMRDMLSELDPKSQMDRV